MLYASVSCFLTNTCAPERESARDSTNVSFATSFVALHEERENMARTSNNSKVLILSVYFCFCTYAFCYYLIAICIIRK